MMFDRTLEKEILWRAMMGKDEQKQAIFARCKPAMFSGETVELFRSAHDLFLAGEPYQLPEVVARYKDVTGKNYTPDFFDGCDNDSGNPAPLIDRLISLSNRRTVKVHIEAATENLENGADPLEIARDLREALPASDAPEHLVFRPGWDNQPASVPDTIKLNGHRIGSPGNVSLLIAGAGHGKSAICEALAASVLNPDCDSFGLKVVTDRPVVYLDTERSTADSWTSWERMGRRAGVPAGGDCSKIHFELIALLPTIDARRDRLSMVIRELNPGLIILDGVADFVLDPNDPLACNAWIFSIMATAKEKGFCIFGTLHPNPNDVNRKGRGHLGSELMRRAESILLLSRDEDGQRTLSMSFEHGKNRSATDNLETFFRWDTMQSMFLSCPDGRTGKPATKEKHIEILRMLDGKAYSFKDLVETLRKATGKEDGKKGADAAKTLLYRLRDKGYLVHDNMEWKVNHENLQGTV